RLPPQIAPVRLLLLPLDAPLPHRGGRLRLPAQELLERRGERSPRPRIPEPRLGVLAGLRGQDAELAVQLAVVVAVPLQQALGEHHVVACHHRRGENERALHGRLPSIAGARLHARLRDAVRFPADGQRRAFDTSISHSPRRGPPCGSCADSEVRHARAAVSLLARQRLVGDDGAAATRRHVRGRRVPPAHGRSRPTASTWLGSRRGRGVQYRSMSEPDTASPHPFRSSKWKPTAHTAPAVAATPRNSSECSQSWSGFAAGTTRQRPFAIRSVKVSFSSAPTAMVPATQTVWVPGTRVAAAGAAFTGWSGTIVQRRPVQCSTRARSAVVVSPAPTAQTSSGEIATTAPRPLMELPGLA